MRADLPHTLYINEKDKDKGRKKSPGNYKYNPNDPAIAKTMASLRRRKERAELAGGNVQYTLDELFNKQ